MKAVFLTLPAYNEEEGLPRLLEAFERESGSYRGRIVLVDDGSTDGTAQVVEQWSSRLSIDLVRHVTNRGLGETIRDGLARAAGLAAPDDVIVTMDADNTHSPALIRAMLPPLERRYDVAIASRYRTGARVVGLSWFRHLMSYGVRLLFQVVFPISGVRDYSSGFRAYRAGMIQRAFAAYGENFVTEKGFACMAEILLKLHRMGARMTEVPMVLRYDQKTGASKMKVGKTVLKTLSLMLRSRFR